MTIQITLICGDAGEQAVFVTAFLDDLSLVFKFTLDLERRTDVGSRVVACYHDQIVDSKYTFASREEMRHDILSRISEAWALCANHPAVRLPDVIVHLRTSDHIIAHESAFQDYLQHLSDADHVKEPMNPTSAEIRIVRLEDLIFKYSLGGRGSSTLVSLRGKDYVFKGLPFRLFMERGASDFQDEADTFYHQIRVMSSLPCHPNISPPPTMYVTVAEWQAISATAQPLICGYLSPYQRKQSLQEILDESGSDQRRLPLVLKLRWAHQLVSAVAAVHRSGNFHGDLKPGNVLVDELDNILLIDWEQCGASPLFLAPEADGSWDAVEEPPGRVRYTPYVGPPRINSWAWPRWNVYHLWQTSCPQALAAAEVYSMGRVLWALFDQNVPEDFVEDRNSFIQEDAEWSDCSSDVPAVWKDFISRCVLEEPNDRCNLEDALGFWQKQALIMK